MLNNNYSKNLINFLGKKFDFFSCMEKGFNRLSYIDAGMRELNTTGWMHNRVRMIVGSFLVKHLLINWKEGEKYLEIVYLILMKQIMFLVGMGSW